MASWRRSRFRGSTIFRSDLPKKVKMQFWHWSGRESELLRPVAEWLRTFKLSVYAEVPAGTKRVDVLGHRRPGGLFSRAEEFYAVELENDTDQLKRGLDQMTTFADYCNEVYLACTPWLAAEYLDAHSQANNVRRWDGDLLTNKLARFGFGLLLVDSNKVAEVMKPTRKAPPKTKVEEVRKTLDRLRPL
ncbi:MAG: hypothetical protein U1F43_22780 [Myxococcota bacterium]